MTVYYEFGVKQLHKRGEELCGDSYAFSRSSKPVTLVVSDGLGSGVKANILATLTTSIAMHMLKGAMSLDQVVQTLTETLPVCDVRKLAYSTFIIAQCSLHGYARIVEFDSPPAIVVRERKVLPMVYETRTIENKHIKETDINLEIGDWMVFISDGVENAGIGGAYPLGWGWENVSQFVERHTHPDLSAQDVADKVAEAVGNLYFDQPGDDVTIVVIKVRKKRTLFLFTGPPDGADEDKDVVSRFVGQPGMHVICGGTTAKIVSRNLGRPLEVELESSNPAIPPIARMEGFELVTEGILTLTQVLDMLHAGLEKKDIQFKTDGASSLLRILLEADHVHFLVGRSVNPAHQNPELPQKLEIRHTKVSEIARVLETSGKEITLEMV